MAVELKGYSNQINQESMLKQGLENLRHADREQAREHLADLRRDLQTKTGVVRLLHTTKTDKDMKFKNAGAFKRMFLAGDKLKRSGDVIKDLLRNAGLSEAKVEEFGKYAAARGNKGVQAQKVLQYIDTLQAETGATAQEALGKFGVDLRHLGPKLGEGGFGEVHLVKYRGEDFVYKSPGSNSYNLGQLTMVDGAGRSLKPDPVVLKKSYVDVLEEESSGQGKQPPNNLLLRSGQEANYKPSAEYDNKVSYGYSSSHSSESYSQPMIALQPQIVEEDPIEHQGPPPSQASAEGQKLARTGIGNVARVKDLPQVITPSVLVVREGLSDGTERFHAVAGHKTLKDWAKVQNKGSTFEVVGLLMPKAAGKPPFEYSSKMLNKDDDGPSLQVKVNVARSDLKPLAESAMTLLKGMAQHGFIHGDIKHENLIWDAETKKLQLIDNDDLKKVSKNPGSQVPKGLGAATSTYLNPIAQRRLDPKVQDTQARTGLGRDLYAMGLVLLEASVMAQANTKDEIQNAMSLVDSISMRKLKDFQILLKKGIASQSDPIFERLANQNFPLNSPEAFARSCILKSIAFEKDRLQRQDFGFDRSENGPEAALIKELEAELAQVR